MRRLVARSGSSAASLAVYLSASGARNTRPVRFGTTHYREVLRGVRPAAVSVSPPVASISELQVEAVWGRRECCWWAWSLWWCRGPCAAEGAGGQDEQADAEGREVDVEGGEQADADQRFGELGHAQTDQGGGGEAFEALAEVFADPGAEGQAELGDQQGLDRDGDHEGAGLGEAGANTEAEADGQLIEADRETKFDQGQATRVDQSPGLGVLVFILIDVVIGLEQSSVQHR